MQELLGRLTALDPQASETLKVVSYFDALVAAGVGTEGLVRSAAALTGVPVGFHAGERTLRVEPDGRRADADPGSRRPWPSREAGDGALVWIERSGAAHANDAMVLERLAIALAITSARRTPDAAGSVEVAVSPHASDEERGMALSRLRLDAAPCVRAIARPPDTPSPAGDPSAIVVTARGLARAEICSAEPVDLVGGRAGIGIPVPPDRLAESWASALVALRLATDDEPVVDADALGPLLLLAEAADARGAVHPDAAALAALDPRALDLLDALARTGSVRSAAGLLGMHHSSAQEKLSTLGAALGYDPRTSAGRTRFALARALLQLSQPGL